MVTVDYFAWNNPEIFNMTTIHLPTIHYKTSLICFYLLFTSISCQQLQLNSNSSKPIVLASQNVICKNVTEDHQWRLFLGLFNLKQAEFTSFKFKSGNTYRYQEYTTWLDALITVPLGAFLTITRSTVSLQECQESVVLQTSAEVKQEKQAALDYYLKNTIHKGEDIPVFIMNSGEKHLGKIQEITKTKIILVIETLIKIPENENDIPTNDIPVKKDIIHLKTGKKIIGKIRTQNKNDIIIHVKSDKQRIFKKDIKRVEFNKLIPPKIAEQTRIEKQIITLHRKNIRKIYFPSSR